MVPGAREEPESPAKAPRGTALPRFVDRAEREAHVQGVRDRPIVAVACSIAALLLVDGGRARADGRLLGSLQEVHAACQESMEGGRRELYELRVDPGWRFESFDAEGERLSVDTRRNLRAVDGRVSLLVAGLEPVGFEADADQAENLRTVASGETALVVGFFLGFDEPTRRPCLLRGAHGVTIVRVDLAYAELQTVEGERLTRTETDRLRAWNDDDSEIPGHGPRGRLRPALFEGGAPVPESWSRALERASLGEALGRCHAGGIERGGAGRGSVVVRLNVESRSGRVRRADVALSAIGDDEAAECVAREVGRGLRLPPGPSSFPATVDLAVPVELTD
jgi:hypothetical protein